MTGDGFAFSPITLEGMLEVLQEKAPQKYKLQRELDGRWRDASKYTMLDSSGEVIDAVRAGHSTDLDGMPLDVIRRAGEAEPNMFRTALRTLNRGTAERLSKHFSASSLLNARDVALRVNEAVDTRTTRYLAASLDAVHGLTQFPIEELLTGTATTALGVMSERVGSVPDLYAMPAAEAAVAALRGKVLSVVSREDASREFAKAREGADAIKALYVDMGALTYFDTPDIDNNAEQLADTIRRSVFAADPGGLRNHTAVAMSVDANYLRIYAPILMHYAQQMPDVDHNIILCGDSGDTVEELQAFRTALAVMNRSGAPDNVRIYEVPVPAEVVEPRTFYACARFFAIDALLEQYPSVYVMDIDLTTNEDPRSYFRSLTHVPFAVPTSRGFDALSPWRRYMAGNLAVNRDALETNIVSDVQSYLAHGLTQPNSWMLDQNALTYTIERNPEAFMPLDPFLRPFTQPRFRTVWEKAFRA
ncbi:hypothetical protein [Brachybacterium endophyticum]|nr:hypothetical protein [Brachybacterium endophyticum]